MALGKLSGLLCLFLLCVIGGAYAGGYGYGLEDPKAEASKIIGKKLMPGLFSVQGIVYCKSASKVLPLKGGVVRITCLGIDKYGYETAPFSILSHPTDANGYFLAKLSAQLLEESGVKISQCKAFLHSSSLKSCPIATEINKGLTGAPLSAYRAVGSNNMRLYSVGPFVYTSEPQPSISTHY
ncbi:proline-rich protein 3 [Phtheirospermum japonicum]|uniref:Proline-rich protein 3 n=1 Tax=Phtheirospermum japonicum TaxID=374723 RepID=A0A830CYG2_9LAMI|nr:proline-rich protein 3 [Phtheirospermum japonicum]